MLCKKCKTAIDENAKVCKYCGAKAGVGQSAVVLVLLGVVVVLAAILALYLMRAGGGIADEVAPPESLQPQSVVELETPEQTEIVEPAQEESYFEVKPTPTPPPHVSDTSRPEDEVWALIENMAVAANDYYERNYKSRVIISKNGYLYNYPAKSYFTPKNFTKIESMKPEYAEEQVLLLYMRSDDLKEYLDLPEGSELEIFCAYEIRDGFAVANDSGRVGVISREDFQKVLACYSDERGGAYRAENDSQDFADVVEGVRRFKSGEGGYDVRYLVFDSKYAFVVLSEKNAPEMLEEYVLVDTDGNWTVGLSGFEKEFMYQKIINNKYPDFDIGMLPPYNLYYDSKDIRSNISPLIEAMRTQDVISEEDGRATFATGTEKFCYIELESGKKLLGTYAGTEKGWLIHTVNNFLHAELIMYDYDKEAPTFIVKQ